jgi:hypothetical protein
MRKIALLMILMILLTCCQQKDRSGQSGEWIQLFNGKDLADWKIKFAGYELNNNLRNTFRVEDGLLKVCYDEWDSINGEYGHIFYKDKFSRYILRVEYRFVGEQTRGGQDWAFRNNGAMLHCQSPESMLVDQAFPVSIEGQLLGGEGNRTTANLCTPGTNVFIADTLVEEHCINSTSKYYPGDQWVTVEFHVYGDDAIYHIIEGDTVMAYTHPQVGGWSIPDGYPLLPGTPVTEGYIAFQAESHPTEFRKIELLDLSK